LKFDLMLGVGLGTSEFKSIGYNSSPRIRCAARGGRDFHEGWTMGGFLATTAAEMLLESSRFC
jgi:hypothetical protein